MSNPVTPSQVNSPSQSQLQAAVGLLASSKRNTKEGLWGIVVSSLNLDKLGILLSSLCALHCLLLPVIIMSMPIMARYYLTHPWFHVVLALLIWPTGLFAFLRGFGHHRNVMVLILGLPGMIIVTIVPYLFHSLQVRLNEPLWVTVGSGLLIAAHVINRKACPCEQHHH